MKTRTYPYTPKEPRAKTGFKEKWGITAAELAAEEGLSNPAAIHMRVHNFGTPFQRKKAPTICEIMTGKTVIELAHELNLTPISVAIRLKTYGDPYYETDWPAVAATRGTTRGDLHWSKTKLAGVAKGTKEGWLSPRHPEYHTWRYKYIQQHCPTGCDTNTEEK